MVYNVQYGNLCVHVNNVQVRYMTGDDYCTIGYWFYWPYQALIIDSSSSFCLVETWPVLTRHFCQRRLVYDGYGRLALRLHIVA